MTQPGPTGVVGTDAQLQRPPYGFARPKVPPLSTDEPAPQVDEEKLTLPPDSYALPAQPLSALESIAPAPAEVRDPNEPFTHVLPQAPESTWQPTQPLPLSSAVTTSEADPSTQPPPSGPELNALPPPTGQPVGTPLHTLYPVNPYATGPYSAPTRYGAPYGVPGAPWGPNHPVQPGHKQQITLQQVLRAADNLVMLPLFMGMVWPQTSALALIVAAVIAIGRSNPARVLVGAACGICLFVTYVWFSGYIATSQWQSAAQLLCTVCAIGVPLIAYQSLRKWS